MLVGGPIVIEEFLKANRLASPGPRPRHITAADLDLDAQLGRRTNISAYAQTSESTREKEKRDIQGLG